MILKNFIERKADKTSKMPQIICFMLTMSVMSLSYLLFYREMPTANAQIALVVLGALMAKWGDSVGYFLNESRAGVETKKLLARNNENEPTH